jgi:hypothetical protein
VTPDATKAPPPRSAGMYIFAAGKCAEREPQLG